MMFSNKQLLSLLLPIMVEQLLNSFMGMADTMMVSNVGSAAISAVSLVDSINVLVIQVFTALGAGAAIICSQYLGRGDRESSNEAARQVTLSVLTISTVLSILCIVFRGPLLHLIFGQVEEAVMDNSMIYFLLTAISFPFIALFDAGGAFYRAAGNSRFPMMISVLSNGLNIAGNAVLIFGFLHGHASRHGHCNRAGELSAGDLAAPDDHLPEIVPGLSAGRKKESLSLSKSITF